MYDNCGHDHCNRLKYEITLGSKDGSDHAGIELALWLWEVHNSVNIRLMKEAAQRQNRNVTNEETLASIFPTKNLCPDCWLDLNMTKWDYQKVFQFLDEWYWPKKEPADTQFKSVVGGALETDQTLFKMAIHRSFEDDSDEIMSPSFQPSFSFTCWIGFGFISLIAFLVVAIIEARKGNRRRKKFVDSRFVKKKQGCF